MNEQNRQVLVVSPSSIYATRLGIIFICLGFQPLLARTASEAINLAHKNFPSLIFFDTDLPGKELQSMLSVLRLDPATKNLPLIITTNHRDSSDQESLLTQGCTEVLTKPIDVAQVFQMLGNVFGLRRKSLRVPVLLGVEIGKGLREKTLDCTNISEGGMFLCTDEPIPKETVVNVKFSLPFNNEQFELRAEVERTVPPDQRGTESGMGLKFLELPDAVRKEIRRFIQQSTIGALMWEPHSKAFDHAFTKTNGNGVHKGSH